MRLESIHIRDFKRFLDLRVTHISKSAKLVLLTGPNGSGKTSLFEAFNYWINFARGPSQFDIEYHARSAGAPMENEETLLQKINLNFHDIANPANDPVLNKKAFYIRSAYRNESTFTTNNLGNADDILNNSQHPERLIYQEQRVSENYKHMVAETVKALYSNDPEIQQKNVGELADELIGEVRDAMLKVFDDLVLRGARRPADRRNVPFQKRRGIRFSLHEFIRRRKGRFRLAS